MLAPVSWYLEGEVVLELLLESAVDLANLCSIPSIWMKPFSLK